MPRKQLTQWARPDRITPTKINRNFRCARVVGAKLRGAGVAILMLAGCASDFAGIDWDDLDNCGADDAVSALVAVVEVKQAAVLQIKSDVPKQASLGARESLAPPRMRDFLRNSFFQYWHEQTHERAPPLISTKIGDVYVIA
jgi:hypothetical protein